MIGLADQHKRKKAETFEELKTILKKLKHNPPNGFGKTIYQINWTADEIKLIEVSTKNHDTDVTEE